MILFLAISLSTKITHVYVVLSAVKLLYLKKVLKPMVILYLYNK